MGLVQVDDAGQLADRFHLLALAKRRLDPLALGRFGFQSSESVFKLGRSLSHLLSKVVNRAVGGP